MQHEKGYCSLTRLGPQSRFGAKLLGIRVIYIYIYVSVQCTTKGVDLIKPVSDCSPILGPNYVELG